MQGFPPAKDGQVTLANWQDPPYNRWSFSHLRELVPTQRIGGDTGRVMSLASEPQPVGELPVPRVAGGTTDLDRVLDDTYTDAVVVVHDGRIVWERYCGETRPDTAHLLMSISKSVVGCVVASLVDRGQLHPTQLVTDHVPELAHSGYRGARVRHLLDMRSGIKFSEQYTDLEAEVRVIEQAMGWRPSSHHDIPRSMYGYLTTLTQAREHGGVFEYRSCETDVLGWVCERAAGTRMANLIADRVWGPIGAEHDAEITCDGVGTAVHDGGMCATARDVARFGMMLLADGEVAGRTVVPAEWLRASWTVDTDVREAFARSASGPYLPGGWYRNQFWFLPREHGPVLLCLGIYGQMLYVNPATATVAAKLSSWPDAQAPALLHDTLNAFDAVGAVLAGHPANAARLHGLPGLAAGLSRRGGSDGTGQRSDHRLRLATRPAGRQEDKMLEPPSPVPTSTAGRRLNGISEIRGYFRTNTEPVYFFGPTAFNLLGIDRWVRNFFYVAYYDSWDGAHPRVFSPRSKPYVEFTSSEDINNYLLRDPEVQAFIAARGGRPRVAMVFFDEETERLCEELGYDLILPSDALRRHLDSKIVTTRLGNEAGAPSVPNVLVEVDSWGTLVRVSTDAGLGTDLVVQTPYGDSGKTTFFMRSEQDWSRYGADIAGQHVKVMKRINNKAAAVEGVLTRHGTVVGPFMTDLTGYPELTPYKGGWCGNDLFPEALSEAHRARAIELIAARRPARRRGLPGVLRGGCARRPGRRRGVSGGAEPEDLRRLVDDQRHGRGVRRHPAVPVPPAGVLRRRLSGRRR